jgi:DNA (cytosine-5)-methyltransferase 1
MSHGQKTKKPFGFYEFFAGGGMARLGLGQSWHPLIANDFDPKKVKSYTSNFRDNPIISGDIKGISPNELPSNALMAWASFPCQDLSLAGNGKGLEASRSGCYWPFWKIMKDLSSAGSPVPILAIENVVGLLHSKKGADFELLLRSLHEIGYAFGAMVVDAIHFLPQSRPRLFIVATKFEIIEKAKNTSNQPIAPWHTPRIIKAFEQLPKNLRENWVWWDIPTPPKERVTFESVILDNPASVSWHEKAETDRLLSLMSPLNLKKVEEASKQNKTIVGTVYKRTRPDGSGNKVQRAEVRFDGIAGCLRTPAGGSSRQTIIVVEGKKIRTRLLDTREAARLMGVPDTYKLPKTYNDAYHLMGDGLAVPAVAWIEKHVLRPLALAFKEKSTRASGEVA